MKETASPSFKHANTKNVFYQVRLKLTQWFTRFNKSSLIQCILNISLLSSNGKGHDPSFDTFYKKDVLCEVWLKLPLWFLRKKRCLMLSVYFHPVANIYMYFGKVIKQS